MTESDIPRKVRETLRLYEELSDRRRQEYGEILPMLQEKMTKAKERREAGDIVGALTLQEEINNLLRENAKKWEEIEAVATELHGIYVEAHLAGSKLQAEVLKQQATFSAGAIVGVAVSTKALFPEDPIFVPLLGASFGILLFTVCLSLLLLHIEALGSQILLFTGEFQERGRLIRIFRTLAAGGLPVAVVLFLVFAGANLPS